MFRRGHLLGSTSLWSQVVRSPENDGSQQQGQQQQGQQQQGQQEGQQQGQQQQQQQQQIPGFLHQASPALREKLAPIGLDTFEKFGESYLELYKNAGANRVVLPGESATQEEWTAFNHSIGVPKDAKDYVLEVDGVKVDEGMGNFARELFPLAGVTKRGGEILVKGWNKLMADTLAAHTTAQQQRLEQGEAAWAKSNGANHAAHQDIAMRAAEFAGLSAEDVTALKQTLGVEKAMGLLLKYGNAAASDGPEPTGGRSTFNITTPEQAKAELARMESDPTIAKVLTDPSHAEYKATRDKWNRLTDQIANFNSGGR